MNPRPRLFSLPRSFRFGLGCLVVVLLFGLGTGAAHLVLHHENRDAEPGLTLDDVRGAYHGIRAEAPLLKALDRALQTNPNLFANQGNYQ